MIKKDILFFVIIFGFIVKAQTGIGTVTPLTKLHVASNGATFRIEGINHTFMEFFPQGRNTRFGYLGFPDAGVNNLVLMNESSGVTILGTNATERMRITLDGSVGIGTTNPTARLNLVGGGIKLHNGFRNNTTRPALTTTNIGSYEIRGVGSIESTSQVDSGNDGFLRLSAGGGTHIDAQSSIDLSGFSNVPDMNNNIVFRTSGTERLRIDSGGNLGIGTSNPSVRLQVAGDIIANSIAGSSDARFKKNITTIENPLQKVLQLHGVTFDWKTEEFPERKFSKKRALGLIAQEVERVVPEIVQTESTAEGYKSVQYDKVVALLVEAIKEQQKQINVLKIKIKRLKKNKK